MNTIFFKTARRVAWGAIFVASSTFAQSNPSDALENSALVDQAAGATMARPRPERPQPARPQPARPQPARPQPARPQPVRPQPVRPQPVRPQPVRPQPVRPQPVRPQPVRPQPVRPQPVRPQPVRPEPVKPNPIKPQPVKPEPVKPNPIKPQPVEPKPTEPKPITQPGSPVSDQQRQQNQKKAKEDLQRRTDEAKAKVPSHVAQQIPEGGSAKLSKDNKSVAIKDHKTGATKIVDVQTGKPLASYNKTTGAKPTKAPLGAKVEKNGGVTTTTAPGFKKVVDEKGNSKTTVRNTTINETVVNKKTVIVNKSVVINNRTVIINENRREMRTFNPFTRGYVRLFVPLWWGAPAFMANGWVIEGGIHVYGLFFGIGGYIREGYVSPWNRYQFVPWNANPYICREERWREFHTRWNWGWAEDVFYVGYYRPFYEYRNLGYWIADYRLQRELETERLERLAAEEDAEYAREEAAELIENRPVINPNNEPISDSVMERLAVQTEQMVASINKGEDVFASAEVANNHIFTVEGTLNETATIDGTSYNCKLKSGDLIEADQNVEQDVEPVLDSAGNPTLDEDGNVQNTTFVTMKVVASKIHSCAVNSRVVVQMDTLQSLLNEEKARVQEGMEQSITLGIRP